MKPPDVSDRECFLKNRDHEVCAQLDEGPRWLPWMALLFAFSLGFAAAAMPLDEAEKPEETATAAPLEEAMQLDAEALALFQAGDLENAERLTERALAFRRQTLEPDHPLIASSLGNLGWIRYAAGDLTAAVSLFARQVEMLEKTLGAAHPEVIGSLELIWTTLWEAGDLAGALPYLERAIAAHEQALGSDHPDLAPQLETVASLYQELGDLGAAVAAQRRALEIHRKTPGYPPAELAVKLTNLAHGHLVAGEFEAAAPLYEEVLAIREKVFGRDHVETAMTVNNLAMVSRETGDLRTARQLYERARRAFERAVAADEADSENLMRLSTTISNLGTLHLTLGDLETARDYLERALEIGERALGPEDPAVASTLNNLGSVFWQLGDLEAAYDHHRRALEISRLALGSEHPEIATLHLNLGSIADSRGDFETAATAYATALAIFDTSLGPRHLKTAEALNSLGTLQHRRGSLEAGRETLERALEVRLQTRGPEHPDTAITLENLGLLHLARGDVGRALEFVDRALKAQESSLEALTTLGSERERRHYLRTFLGSTLTAVSLHAHFAPDDPRALELAFTTLLRRKARELDASAGIQQRLRQRGRVEDRELLERLAVRREAWAQLLLQSDDPAPDEHQAAERQARFEELRLEIERLERELATRSESAGELGDRLTLEDVQARVPPRSALVELTLYNPFDPVTLEAGEPRYAAYVLRRSGKPQWVALERMSVVNEGVDLLRRALAGNRQDVEQLGRRLDEATLARVRPLLGDAEELLLSPDGALQLIPFAALIDEQRRYLIERYRISYLTSGRDLIRSHAPAPRRQPALVIGGVSFGRPPEAATEDRNSAATRPSELRFKSLSGTAAEARTIARVFDLPADRLLTGTAATETALKSVHGPYFLHLATHGFFLGAAEDEPLDVLLRSGLALAGVHGRRPAKDGDDNPTDDGLLTALEVASLDLEGTAMAVLSACDSGRGEVRVGEAVQGLRYSLALAGARTQVMTLWQVADKPTRKLMESWYRQLERGVGRSEALRRTQLAALTGRPLPATEARLAAHPYFWAGFLLAGDTGPLPAGEP